MLAKVESACLIGMEAARVHVEVNLAKGLPSFSIVGLPDASVREARDRVVAAIRNAGFEFPSRRVTVNLAPADLKKEGAFFDLAIAVGVLIASEAISPVRSPRCVWLGELALDGSIRAVRGALPLARGLSQKGWKQLVLPSANIKEVSFLDDISVYSFRHLNDVVRWLTTEASVKPMQKSKSWSAAAVSASVDVSDIKGQAVGKRALEIAAAGGHNLLFIGCPGTGKSMLAQSLPALLPAWTLDEALDASQVHSAAGHLHGTGLLASRPFRSPHHSVSPAALIGGGDSPMPGEISLAHRGVLFMDELPEFRRDALEALRQPLEEGVVNILRVRGRATYPARFMLITAMNPCPCGYRGHPKRECICSPTKVQKYIAKISGPFLDRIDLQVEIPALKIEELFDEAPPPEPSITVQSRVEKARSIQARRYGGRASSRLNADLKGKDLKRYASLDDESKVLMKAVIERLGLSARAYDRIRKVARTIADLEGSDDIKAPHIAEAIQYRILDRKTYDY